MTILLPGLFVCLHSESWGGVDRSNDGRHGFLISRGIYRRGTGQRGVAAKARGRAQRVGLGGARPDAIGDTLA
jgi:hypothetical protein